VLKRVAENGGSIQGLDDLFDEEAMRGFVVAYDIPWWDHVRAQYHAGPRGPPGGEPGRWSEWRRR